MSIVVVAYDVSDDRRRYQLAALLSHHGVRLQRSVFQCRILADQLPALAADCASLIDENTDVVHFFRQCEPCKAGQHVIGQEAPDLAASYWIV